MLSVRRGWHVSTPDRYGKPKDRDAEMSEQSQPYITATAPHVISRDESVTLVTSKRTAALVHRVQALSNQHRRGDAARFAVVDLETLEIGSIIVFES